MTVCIAAIYNGNSILGASDRMVTSADIQFEPTIPKILSITNSIAIMTAGDQNIQSQVYLAAAEIVRDRINAEPKKWLNVHDVADIYSNCFYQLRNKLAENQILSSYQLTLNSFISNQKETSQDFIDKLSTRIDRFQMNYMEDVAAIIAGVDTTGPHIYVVRNGIAECNDKLGFAAIGIGSNHALSHFMVSEYSALAIESKALLTIHQAKKKAEVSPGVGEQTDMCVIGPALGSFAMIQQPPFKKDIVKDLDGIYKQYKRKIEALDQKTEEKIKDYLKHLVEPVAATQAMITLPSAPLPEPLVEEDKIKMGEKNN